MVCFLRIELRHSGLQPDALPTELKAHILELARKVLAKIYINTLEIAESILSVT